MICEHFNAHVVTPFKSARDQRIKEEMERLGWFWHGYCPEYYPEWLYVEIGRQLDKFGEVTGKV